jgi:hypothetical protein
MKNHNRLLLSPFQAKDQDQWITSPIGLLGCPASFQCLVEGVLRNISNVIVNIDDLLVHTKNHVDQLKILEKYSTVYIITTSKSILTNASQETKRFHTWVSHSLLKAGKNKLKAIKDYKTPINIKMICLFVSLCNFFHNQFKNITIIATPLFKLTHKDSGYKGRPLPKKAMDVFYILKNSLIFEPVMAISLRIGNTL